MRKIALATMIGIVGAYLFAPGAFSATSENYKINADVLSIGGESGSSENYILTDTVGEAIIGVGTSENYKEKSGFWYMVGTSLSLTVDSNAVNLGEFTPGTPVEGQSLVSVTTDSWGGYDLLSSQNHPLTHTDTLTTIPNYSCSIASPCLWNGSGLGFTVKNGTQTESKWGVNPDFKFAAFPTDATIFHTKGGFSSGADTTTVGYKVDAPSTQKSGDYSNVITYTAISKL